MGASPWWISITYFMTTSSWVMVAYETNGERRNGHPGTKSFDGRADRLRAGPLPVQLRGGGRQRRMARSHLGRHLLAAAPPGGRARSRAGLLGQPRRLRGTRDAGPSRALSRAGGGVAGPEHLRRREARPRQRRGTGGLGAGPRADELRLRLRPHALR